jgi:hypothetical protein
MIDIKNAVLNESEMNSAIKEGPWHGEHGF